MSAPKERLVHHLTGCIEECRQFLEYAGFWASMCPEDQIEGRAVFTRIRTTAAELISFIERGEPLPTELEKFVISRRGELRFTWAPLFDEGRQPQGPQD